MLFRSPKTTVLFVGYCAEGTLGRRIRDGVKQVNILGESFHVNAHIDIVDSFSGHADHSELVDYFNHIQGPKSQTWLVHGEPEGAQALQVALEETGNEIAIAKLGDEVEI